MKRRNFVFLLGSAFVVLPRVARAQQPIIGFLSSRSAGESASVVAAFLQGLRERGYVEGQNLAIEYRWADGRYDRLPTLAAELVDRHATVIVAVGGEPSALAAKAVTSTIPIVFTTGGDPVKLGLVASLARPGNNLTGVALLFAEVQAKRLQMLQELVPAITAVALLVNPTNAATDQDTREMEVAARSLGLQLQLLQAATDNDFDTAFATILGRRLGGLIVAQDPFFIARRDQLVTLAARHAVPTIYFSGEFVRAGGLISYGGSLAAGYRQVGLYAGRILEGTKPADLPVVQPTKFELVVNLKTAEALGLTVPQTILGRADEVIE
jgi:putative ABC transport system substrate-binding protein